MTIKNVSKKSINKKTVRYGLSKRRVSERTARSKGALQLEIFLNKNGYSLRQAAKILDMDFTNLYYIITGRHAPNIKLATKLYHIAKINFTDWVA